jgi:hypothetical protein
MNILNFFKGKKRIEPLSNEYLSKIEKELTDYYDLQIRLNHFTDGNITFYIVNNSTYYSITLNIDTEITTEIVIEEINNKFENFKDQVDTFNKLYKDKIREEKLNKILK